MNIFIVFLALWCYNTFLKTGDRYEEENRSN